MPPPPTQQTLYLIDGHAQIFRAYYAIRGGMTSPVTGEPTQATFGFVGMLLKLYRQFHPQYVIVAHDTPGRTFRDDLFPEYKANRGAPPEDLPPQIDRIYEMTKLFGIPTIGVEGFEADDVIATIIRKIVDDPRHAGVHVRIVSKDKDLEQLLSERVSMFDIHTDTLITPGSLMEDKGVTPEQVVDLLCLMGDTADNIPGAPGIGPKTAAALIQEFGSLDNLLGQLDKVKGKKRENLESSVERLRANPALFKLREDVPITFDLDDATVGAVHGDELRRLFRELGFRRHQADLDAILGKDAPAESGEPSDNPAPAKPDDTFAASLFDAGPLSSAGTQTTLHTDAPRSTAKDFHYTAVTTLAGLEELAQALRKQKIIAVDTETVGLGHRTQLCGLSFSWQQGQGVYVPTRSPDRGSHPDTDTVLNILRGVLEDPSVPKTGHNIKYDMLVLRYAGVHLRGVVFDSMIASFLTQQHGHGMDALAMSLLNHETIPITSLIGHGGRGQRQRTMDTVPLADITTYAAEDADITLRLYHALGPMLEDQGMSALAERVEMPLVEVLAEMEFAGITVEPGVLAEQKQELGQRIVELREAVHKAAGSEFNVDSPRQLADVLFTRLKAKPIKRTKTGPSTDSEVLERLSEMDDADPRVARLAELVLEYRQLTKLVSTYLDALRDAIQPDTKRVHASFHQTGAATGRLSSSDPNLQNIPIRTEVGRQIRRAFIAPPGHVLISADYSQIELRMLAHLSEDKGLIDAFARDMDIHTAVASQVFGVNESDVTKDQRAYAKVVNFGIIYGISAFGLARRIETLDLDGAKKLIADYKMKYPGIDAFLDRCVDQATRQGHVTTILGRRRNIAQVKMANPQVQQLGQRLAINTVVQGSAADLIKLAMVNLHRRIERESLPLKMLLQIHDELVLECPGSDADAMKAVVIEEMTGAMKLKVPLRVEAAAGSSWYDAK
ncbi:MAG: DNA polymerase I [Phycisphaera sp.]|nr:DNA polymerase I [Phycisphaera sp.]